MELSKRLQKVVDMMPPMRTICDIGCDHGYVSIALLQKKKAQHMIAMDVNQGPLDQAKHNAAVYGMTEQMEFRLSDGLKKTAVGEADAFLCAGMGGRLIVRIMTEGKEVMEQMKGAVLQPQSELSLVRAYIYAHGWHIVQEDMVFEADDRTPAKGIYYPVMYIEPGKEQMPTEAELLFGPKLLKQKHPVLKQYLEFSKGLKQELIRQLDQASKGQQNRAEQLQQEIAMIEQILKEYVCEREESKDVDV